MSFDAAALVALLAGQRGHFQMESGYHSQMWYDLDRVLADRPRLAPFVRELGRRLAAHQPDAICGPMSGGALLAQQIAAERGWRALHTERHENPQATGLFPVRYTLPVHQRELVRGQRVVIVDDAISAGSAVRGTHADLLACGAEPVAMGALFIFGAAADRFAIEQGLAIESLARPPYSLWKPTECPLCAAGSAFEKVSERSPPQGRFAQ